MLTEGRRCTLRTLHAPGPGPGTSAWRQKVNIRPSEPSPWVTTELPSVA
jgi:hypothetical protein